MTENREQKKPSRRDRIIEYGLIGLLALGFGIAYILSRVYPIGIALCIAFGYFFWREARRRNVKAVVAYCVYLLILIELAARAFFCFEYRIPFFANPSALAEHHYPGIRTLDAYQDSADTYNILLLGGSVVSRDWGAIDKHIEEGLTEDGTRRVRVHNFGAPAHMSRDSLNKYLLLENKSFDLVIIYHGINDHRTNYVPPEIWRDDYSHLDWFATVNFYVEHSWQRYTLTMIPLFLRALSVRAGYAMNQFKYGNQFVGKHGPRRNWLKFGTTVRSARSFENNLRRLIELVGKKNEQVLLMGFASCPEKCEAENGLTVWGPIDHVTRAIRIHNHVAEDLAAEYENASFFDQHERFAGRPELFKDLCHFEETGCEAFAANCIDFLNEKQLVPSIDVHQSER